MPNDFLTEDWAGVVKQWQEKAPDDQTVKFLSTENVSSPGLAIEHDNVTLYSSDNFRCQNWNYKHTPEMFEGVPLPKLSNFSEHAMHKQKCVGVITADLTQPDTDATRAALDLMQVTFILN